MSLNTLFFLLCHLQVSIKNNTVTDLFLISCYLCILAERQIGLIYSTFHSVEMAAHHFPVVSVDLFTARRSLMGDRERVLFDGLA